MMDTIKWIVLPLYTMTVAAGRPATRAVEVVKR